jgi:phosphatidylethanolamine/phosphatidyl-N-methylethanolamine N-methyltransferase
MQRTSTIAAGDATEAAGGPADPAAESARSVGRTYDRMAPLYDKLDAVYEWSWKRRLRAELFRHARGRDLLDVGVGTGCNMPFYPAGARVVGIDASRGMLARARGRARALGREVELRQMNLLRLDLPDASFDTVAVTFVLLCLPDELQLQALRELRRVTRPGGRVLLLDYRGSSRRHVQVWTKALSTWLRWAFAARFDPATDRYLHPAGLRVETRRSHMGEGVALLVLRRDDDPGAAGAEAAAAPAPAEAA